MNLNEFLKPHLAKREFKKSQLGSRIQSWDRKGFRENSIYLLGVSNIKGKSQTVKSIRSELYELFIFDSELPIIDLGDVISVEENDRDETITEVMIHVEKTGSLLIILTENQQDFTAFFNNQVVNEHDEYLFVTNLLHGVGGDVPLKLFQKKQIHLLSYLAIQSYFLDSNLLKKDKKPLICRLGELRDDIHETEPYFRMATRAVFDLNAMRYSDFPIGKAQNPNGLYAEELCQLAWFAGNSETLKSIALTGTPDKLASSLPGIKLVAQLIWHIISGRQLQQHDLPHETSDTFTQYHIDNNKIPEELVVFKSRINGKHWLKYGNTTHFIPCTQNDMEALLQTKVSDRILEAIRMI